VEVLADGDEVAVDGYGSGGHWGTPSVAEGSEGPVGRSVMEVEFFEGADER